MRRLKPLLHNCASFVDKHIMSELAQRQIETARDEGGVWRFLSLLQFIIVPIALYMAMEKYKQAETIVRVNERTEVIGESVSELSDAQFITVATRAANLIGTFNPYTVSDQFTSVSQMMTDQAKAEFEKVFINTEMPAIEASSLSQSFNIYNNSTEVIRNNSNSAITVSLGGEEIRYLSGQLSARAVVYQFTMTTNKDANPKNYGILITAFKKNYGQSLQIPKEPLRKKSFSAKKKKKKTKSILGFDSL